MASKTLTQTALRCTSLVQARFVTAVPRISIARAQVQLQSPSRTLRAFHTSRSALQDATPKSAVAQSITTPPAQPPPEDDPNPNKNAAFLGEADSDDGFEASKAVDGDLHPSLDAKNSAFHGEADSDDGFEAAKVVDGEKLEAVDATNSAFLGEADSDDGFVAHREAHPEDGDHKIVDPVESGLHGQTGEQDR